MFGSLVVNRLCVSQMESAGEQNASKKKKVFVAGATGQTGKRIVEQLLSRGFAVKAGVRDVDKAKTSFRQDPSLHFVISFFSSLYFFHFLFIN